MAQGGNGGGPAKEVNKILGNWKDNLLIGTDGVDVISGRGGNDTLIGLAGDDTLDGGIGDDTLRGGAGADVIDGGDGIDTASYAGSGAGVSIDLAAETASGGDADGDTLFSIENLEGSGFSDVLSGDDGANVLTGGDGDDTLTGANGNDVLTGGAGNDQYVFHLANLQLGEVPDGDDIITDFEIGIDKIRFISPFFNALAGAAQVGDDVVITYGGGSTITLLNTQLGALYFGDFLFSGPSVITGTDNDDTLTGSGGSDTILGQGGNDILEGGSGADMLDGGEGIDTASYAGAMTGVTVDLMLETQGGGFDLPPGTPDAGDAEGDMLVSIENVEGSAFSDTLYGDQGTNVLSGGDGDDALFGVANSGVFASGNDSYFGGAGNDRLIDLDGDDFFDGGTGNDYLFGGALGIDVMTGGAGFDIFSVAPAAPTLDPSNTTTITDFEAGIDVIVLGTAIPFDVLATAQQLGADVHIVDDHGKVLILLDTQIADIPESTFIFQNPFVITGSEGADVLTGGDTHIDAIFGFGGDDVLIGNEGNDLLFGGDGNDILYGHSAGVAGFDGETITGGTGDDQLFGGRGDDVLDGGTGDDFINGNRMGDDMMTGGAGADLFSFVDLNDISVGHAPDINPGPTHVTTITDFESGVDSIILEDTPFDVLTEAQELVGGGVMILYHEQDDWAVVLEGLTIADLSASDFSFA
jgi:Ca2+-binding RTX toxin-like protein